MLGEAILARTDKTSRGVYLVTRLILDGKNEPQQRSLLPEQTYFAAT
jgi:hypothetical protein